jgi:hypothetical protein
MKTHYRSWRVLAIIVIGLVSPLVISPSVFAASCTTPSFAAAIPVASAAGRIVAGDFDVDGVPDVIVRDQLLYGDGAGGFVSAQTVVGVRAVASVDLGGITPPIGIKNEAPELLAESTTTPGRAVVGLGSGGRGIPFTVLAGFPVFGGALLSGVTADITGDGIPDLVYSHGAATNNVYLWAGQTMTPNWQSTVAPIELYIGDARAMVAGDFDDDGIAELLIASTTGNALAVFNFRAGQFLRKDIAIPGGPQGLAAADVNGDGFLDAVVTTTSGNVITLLGTGDDLVTNPGSSNVIGQPFNLATTVTVGGELRDIAIGDVNGDLRFDAVVVDRAGKRVVVLTGNGEGGFIGSTEFPTGSSAPISVALADLNRDGALDLLSGDESDAVFVTRKNTCPGVSVDIQVTGLEVTQAISDLAGSVPLFAGRRTFVRAHVRAGGVVDGVTARLSRTGADGIVLDRPLWPINPGARIAVKASPDRKKVSDSFLFELPSNWLSAGPLGLRVDVNPDRLPTEIGFANNTMSRTVTLLETDPIKIALIKVKYFVEAGSGTGCGQTVETSDADLDAAESALRRALPAARFVVNREPWDSGLSLPCTTNIAPGVESGIFLGQLQEKYSGAARDRIRLALYNRDQIGGQADAIPGWFAVANRSWKVQVHEVGHVLGRYHVASPETPPCNAYTQPAGTRTYPYPDARIGGPAGTEQYLGFDLGDPGLGFGRRILGPDTGDIMSYCRDTWPSDVSWVGMRDGIMAKFDPGDPTGDFLVVSGAYDPIARTISAMKARRHSQLGALEWPVPGPLHLRQIGPGGVVLADATFTPVPMTDGDRALINVTVNFAPGTTLIAITDIGGAILASVPVSANRPTVSNVSLSTGSTIGNSGPVTVSWVATDADGGSLRADVSWSRDGGTTFQPLASDVTGSAYTAPAAVFKGTSGAASGVVRVVVRDPVNAGTADLRGIVAAGSAPHVQIAAPFEDESFVRGQLVPLYAYASDPEDGSLDAKVSWNSSLDGDLSVSTTDSALLSRGAHVLTASVTDSDGNVATDDVIVDVFDVLPPGSPPIANAGSDLTAAEGAVVTLDGSGSRDPDYGSLTYMWEVVSAPAGVLDVSLEGPSVGPSFTAVQDGVYVFRLTVSDGRHGESTDDVSVTVTEVAPRVKIVAPASGALFPAGPVTVHAAFSDQGLLDTHTCRVIWDVDGGLAPVSGTVDAAAGTCKSSQTLDAGVYTIRVDVTDEGNTTGSATVMIVVYDPQAGFVTGGGWIDSLAGAYPAAPTFVGRANFGFVSKYKKGASIPTGETEFSFQAGSLRFHSSSYDWLVVSGCKAQYKGVGEVNGVVGFGFLLTAIDGDACRTKTSDRFRIKIWEIETGTTVYDNRLGVPTDIDSADPQAIAGGAIVIRN